jgi:hypothetical protein
MSIGIDAFVATALTLAGTFSVTSSLLVLAGLCLVGCGLQLLAAALAQLPDPGRRFHGQVGSPGREPVASPQR